MRRRAILEFNAASIANNADVQAATLTFDINGITLGSGQFPSVSVYAYAGDGNATSADATRTGTFVGTSQLVTENGEKLEVRLDAAAIESILASSDFLGLLVIGGSNGNQTGILTNEGGPMFGTIAPQLTIAYVPEPASVGAMAVGGVALMMRRRRRHGRAT